MRAAIEEWRNGRTLYQAAEVLDAAFLTGDFKPAAPAARFVLAHPTVVDSVKDAARQVLGISANRPPPVLPAPEERHAARLYEVIANLKRRLSDNPRDAICAVELARVYLLVGQPQASGPFIRRAVALASDNSFILRSAVRYLAHIRDYDEALTLLWKSQAVRFDPLVQSAELALAQVAQRNPKWATKNMKELLGAKRMPKTFSELACGLAGFEMQSGTKMRVVNKLLWSSLGAPTENALAQLMSYSFGGEAQSAARNMLAVVPNTFEARSRQAFRAGHYEQAARWAWQWLEDEPFSIRPATVGAYVAITFLNDPGQAVRFADVGLLANPNDFSLTNLKILGLARSGKPDDAGALLPQLERSLSIQERTPFVRAAQGLVAFRSGNVSGGRTYYEQAVKAAKSQSALPVAFRAVIFWLEEEVYRGQLGHEEFNVVADQIDGHLSKLKEAGDLRILWSDIRERCLVLTSFMPSSSGTSRSAFQETIDSLKMGKLTDQRHILPDRVPA